MRVRPSLTLGTLIVLLSQTAPVFPASSHASPAEGLRAANYERAAEPAVKTAFLPLPPGTVQPAGWLRDWAQAAREGITGHLDERHPTFADGWKGIPVQAPGAAADGTGWPIEQSAYWLDGALRLGLVLHDEALVRKIRARLDPVVEGVAKAPFGTSFIYWKKGYKPQGFDGWAHSQMGRALVALYDATREPRVLEALVKVYADYPANMGGPRLDFGDVSGLCNLDPMLETYSFSGDRRILDRALQAIAQPDPARAFQSWSEGRLAPGHMVIFYENIRLPGLVYPWTGDPHLLQATANAFQWLDQRHLLPYGVASGEEFASGVGAFRKTETCDVTAMLLSAAWMYRIQGSGDWGDRMERAFYNAGAGPVARDFQTMCYYQSPNRLRSDSLPCEQPNCPGPPEHPIYPARLLECPLLRRRAQPHHPQLRHQHVVRHSRQRTGCSPVWALRGFSPGGRRRPGHGYGCHRLPIRRDRPHDHRTEEPGQVPALPADSRLVPRRADLGERRPPEGDAR